MQRSVSFPQLNVSYLICTVFSHKSSVANNGKLLPERSTILISSIYSPYMALTTVLSEDLTVFNIFVHIASLEMGGWGPVTSTSNCGFTSCCSLCKSYFRCSMCTRLDSLPSSSNHQGQAHAPCLDVLLYKGTKGRTATALPWFPHTWKPITWGLKNVGWRLDHWILSNCTISKNWRYSGWSYCSSSSILTGWWSITIE